MALDQAYLSQAAEYIRSAFETYIPGIVISPGSALEDIIINGSKYLLAIVLQEVDRVQQSWNLADYQALSLGDMDRLGENLLVSRDPGDKGYGLVNFYYREPVDVYIFSGIIITNESNTIQVETSSSLSYSPVDFLYEAGEYFIQVPVSTIEYGLAEVPANTLTVVNNRSGQWTRVNNPSYITAGLPIETNGSYYSSIKTAISNRTLETSNGQQALIRELFSGIVSDSLSIGNGDPEMERDTLYISEEGEYNLDKIGTNTGLHVGTKVDTYIRFDNLSYIKKVVAGKREEKLQTISTKPGLSYIRTSRDVFIENIKQTGWVWFEPGTAREERVRYISVSQALGLDNRAYTNYHVSDDAILHQHNSESQVIVIDNDIITVNPTDGDISLVPILYISAIQKLDPVTLSPIGEFVDPVTSTSPGWYFDTVDSYIHMSAREIKNIIIDDKHHLPYFKELSVSDCETSFVDNEVILTAGFAYFSNRQGQSILIYDGNDEKERVVLRVMSPEQIVVSGEQLDSATVDILIESTEGDAGAYPLEITYYTHAELLEAQTYMDESDGRNLCADYLSRAFFPQFLGFSIRFKGTAVLSDVRSALSTFIAGSAYGEFYDETTRTVAITYDQLVARIIAIPGVDYIESPVEIQIDQIEPDGSHTYKWINPSKNNMRNVAVNEGITPGDRYIKLRSVDEDIFIPNDKGRIRLGGYTDNVEYVDYMHYVIDGDETESWFIFILKDSSSITHFHPENQPAIVMHENLFENNIIADNIITSDRTYRPYLRSILIDKLEG